MVIVDTTVWIDYFGDRDTPQTAWLEQGMTDQPLGLTDQILCEILQGIRNNADFERTRQRLSGFMLFDTGGETLAVTSAQNYRFLRARGHTIRRTNDCVIATFCIRKGHSLLHFDRDFDPFEKHLGLHVVHP